MSKANNLFRPAQYFKATSLEGTTALLAQYGRKSLLIAGGTDALILKNPQMPTVMAVLIFWMRHF